MFNAHLEQVCFPAILSKFGWCVLCSCSFFENVDKQKNVVYQKMTGVIFTNCSESEGQKLSDHMVCVHQHAQDFAKVFQGSQVSIYPKSMLGGDKKLKTINMSSFKWVNWWLGNFNVFRKHQAQQDLIVKAFLQNVNTWKSQLNKNRARIGH